VDAVLAKAKETPTSIVLVEDHAILREGVRALLELEHDLEIVGEAGNGVDAVAVAQALSPALVITDIALPGRSGIELIMCLRQILPRVKILILTAHHSEEYIRATLNAGADGYVLKDATRAELLRAIRTVVEGQTYLCASITAKVVSGYLYRNASEAPAAASSDNVTRREREVLTQVALGQSNKLIARALGVSVKTVEKHRANLMRKLMLHNTAAVTRFAIVHGLIKAADLELHSGSRTIQPM
jgi:two-component system, NarL family, response regulator NreC